MWWFDGSFLNVISHIFFLFSLSLFLSLSGELLSFETENKVRLILLVSSAFKSFTLTFLFASRTRSVCTRIAYWRGAGALDAAGDNTPLAQHTRRVTLVRSLRYLVFALLKIVWRHCHSGRILCILAPTCIKPEYKPLVHCVTWDKPLLLLARHFPSHEVGLGIAS